MPSYVIVWEFQVKPGQEENFEEQYGDHGIWAELFKTSEKYQGTKVIKDVGQMSRYVTLDYWSSEFDYERFRKDNKVAYESIDKRCEALTDGELLIGKFHTLENNDSQ